MRLDYLSTVVPVSLVAVVLRRIVGSCNDNSCLSSKFADCKRKFWSRAETCKKIGLDSVCGKNKGRCFCKNVRIFAAVIGDYCAQSAVFCFLRKCFKNVVCKSLGCKVYFESVHAVCSAAHNSAKTSSTKFKSLIESVFQFFHIFFCNEFFYFFAESFIFFFFDVLFCTFKNFCFFHKFLP